LAGLKPEQLERAQAVGKRQKFIEGEVIFREGDTSRCMFIVEDGRVAIAKSLGEAGSQVLGEITPGDFFGEMSLLDAAPRSAQAMAAVPTRLWVLEAAELDQLVEIGPQVMRNLVSRVTERLRQMNDQYTNQVVRQQKLALVEQLGRSIVHDLKTPLTIINLRSQLIERDERHAPDCRIIQRNVDRITHMVSDFLDFSRATSQLRYQEVEPVSWLRDITELLYPVLQRNQVKLLTDVPDTQPLWIDPDKMTRAVYNLCTNAVDAMPEGGLLSLRLMQTEAEAQLDIQDTGGGIPEKIRDRLFEAFVTQGKPNGTGLGTSIAFKILVDHGGAITYETETGRGTTFHLRWPVKPPQNPLPVSADATAAGR
jgi:signal transduction histidine kinase